MERKPDPAIYEITYSEAVRALSEQHSVLESLRARAGLLLSSAAVTTSFLAGQAIHGGRVGPFAWLALFDFTAVAALAIAVLQPRRWEFSAHPGETIASHLAAGGKPTAAELYETLAVGLGRGRARIGPR